MPRQKVLSSSPAGRMTTPPTGEVLHLPGIGQVNHNQWSSVGASRQLNPICPPANRLEKNKTQHTAPLVEQPGSLYSADMNPRGTHCKTMSSPACSNLGKIKEAPQTKRVPRFLYRCLSNPWGGGSSHYLRCYVGEFCFKVTAQHASIRC